MKDELLRLHPGVAIDLINSGRIMEDLGGNISGIDDDVLRYKPDLLVWQIWTNDVAWRGIANNAEEMLAGAAKRIVLLDLQYAPLAALTSRYERMEGIIADVAAEQRVGYFPRFLLIKRAIDAGVTGRVSWDGLHNSAEGGVAHDQCPSVCGGDEPVVAAKEGGNALRGGAGRHPVMRNMLMSGRELWTLGGPLHGQRRKSGEP